LILHPFLATLKQLRNQLLKLIQLVFRNHWFYIGSIIVHSANYITEKFHVKQFFNVRIYFWLFGYSGAGNSALNGSAGEMLGVTPSASEKSARPGVPIFSPFNP
jgi:hypothetical protein